ncbi:MAG: substrate-binding domain-containing protein [Limisphaerales bacterium]
MKKICPLFLTFCLALFFSGCGKKENSAESTPGSAPAKKLKLAFVSNNAANFWTVARSGCEAAAKELGDVNLDFRITASGGSAEQRTILDDLVAKGTDGIAVSVDDPANQTEFLNKIASQTLLICTDSDAPASKRVCYIGTDNIQSGVEVGKLIKQALPNGGNIMLFVGHADAQNAKERYAGIEKELAGSNIHILGTRTDDTDPVRAQKNAEDTLVKYPDIACLVGLWNYNGPAILNAVRAAGKIGKVKIVCFDAEEDTIAGIASGGIFGTVVQNPYEFGKEAIIRMDKYLHGDKSQLSGKIYIPTRAITKDNVAEFEAQQKKLLGQ